MLQQHLPFTVLKPSKSNKYSLSVTCVATALTVYGIETYDASAQGAVAVFKLQQHLPFTVLKLCVIDILKMPKKVATALTVYGIETGQLPKP